MSWKLDSENLKKTHQRRVILKKTENTSRKYFNINCCGDPFNEIRQSTWCAI